MFYNGKETDTVEEAKNVNNVYRCPYCGSTDIGNKMEDYNKCKCFSCWKDFELKDIYVDMNHGNPFKTNDAKINYNMAENTNNNTTFNSSIL